MPGHDDSKLNRLDLKNPDFLKEYIHEIKKQAWIPALTRLCFCDVFIVTLTGVFPVV